MRLFGPAHMGALAVTALAAAALAYLGRSTRLQRRPRLVSACLALLMLANELIWHAHQVAHGIWSVRSSLPLHLCDAAILVSVAALLSRRRLPYELAYYWGLAGSVQALITPGITAPFPAYEFVRYFISHAGIVVAVAYLTWGIGRRPSRGSVARTFAVTALYAAAVAAADHALGANYMFLCAKPATPSLLDLLGPWPWYLIPAAALGLAVMSLLYAPYWLADRSRQRQALERTSSLWPR